MSETATTATAKETPITIRVKDVDTIEIEWHVKMVSVLEVTEMLASAVKALHGSMLQLAEMLKKQGHIEAAAEVIERFDHAVLNKNMAPDVGIDAMEGAKIVEIPRNGDANVN